MKLLEKDAPGKVFQELSAISKKKLHEEIADQIRGLIEAGKLQPGDRLPPERDLAEIFQVSRHSVREALRSLEQQRVLVSRRGSGNFIAQGEAQTMEDFLAQAVAGEKGNLAEIFQFRRLIEPEIARLAALHATRKGLKDLGEILKRQNEPKMTAGEFVSLDSLFHQALARVAKNDILLRIAERINDIFSESRQAIYQSEDRWRISRQGHARVLAAVRDKDPPKARRAMLDHLASIERVVLRPHKKG